MFFTNLATCIVSLQCVGDDIEDLEYTPKPEFEGCFTVTNVKNEVWFLMKLNHYIYLSISCLSGFKWCSHLNSSKLFFILQLELLKKWFAHMREVKPGIYVTYNGDYFDWPFLERRAAHHGFKLSDVHNSYAFTRTTSYSWAWTFSLFYT